MKRNIIEINEDLCNGCGQCVTACAEGAIKMINGKAKLVSDMYCDGLGTCIGHCPTGALKIIEREAPEFDLQKTEEYLAAKKEKASPPPKPSVPCGCPSLQNIDAQKQKRAGSLQSWPIQIALVSPYATFLKGCDLVIAADCTAFAMSDLRDRMPEDAIYLIGCPKLDDGNAYVEKLAHIFKENKPRSITVPRMEVPCCSGLTMIVQQAIAQSETTDIPFKEMIISLDGRELGARS